MGQLLMTSPIKDLKTEHLRIINLNMYQYGDISMGALPSMSTPLYIYHITSYFISFI